MGDFSLRTTISIASTITTRFSERSAPRAAITSKGTSSQPQGKPFTNYALRVGNASKRKAFII